MLPTSRHSNCSPIQLWFWLDIRLFKVCSLKVIRLTLLLQPVSRRNPWAVSICSTLWVLWLSVCQAILPPQIPLAVDVTADTYFISDIAVFVLKRSVILQPTKLLLIHVVFISQFLWNYSVLGGVVKYVSLRLHVFCWSVPRSEGKQMSLACIHTYSRLTVIFQVNLMSWLSPWYWGVIGATFMCCRMPFVFITH